MQNPFVLVDIKPIEGRRVSVLPCQTLPRNGRTVSRTTSREATNLLHQNLRRPLWHGQKGRMVRIQRFHTGNASSSHEMLLPLQRNSRVLLTMYVRSTAVESCLLMCGLVHRRIERIEHK